MLKYIDVTAQYNSVIFRWKYYYNLKKLLGLNSGALHSRDPNNYAKF